MTVEERKQAAKDAPVSRETYKKIHTVADMEALRENLKKYPPRLISKAACPKLSAIKLQLLAWHSYLKMRHPEMPITVLCSLAGVARDTYYDAVRDDEYLGYLMIECRRILGSKAPEATSKFIEIAIEDGDRRALQKMLSSIGVFPTEKHHLVTESLDADDDDEELTDDEQTAVAQGFDKFVREFSREVRTKDQQEGVAGADETPDAQESET